MRRILASLFTVLLAAATLGVTGASAVATDLPAPTGTGPKVTVRHGHPGTLTQVRYGKHTTYDRLVFQASGAVPGWDVRYVKAPVTEDGSGRPVPVAGRAVLHVVLHGIDGHTSTGRRSYPSTPATSGPAIRQVKDAGDFEAVVSFAVGTTGRTGFRVFALTNPSRVVLDVARPVVSGEKASPLMSVAEVNVMG